MKKVYFIDSCYLLLTILNIPYNSKKKITVLIFIITIMANVMRRPINALPTDFARFTFNNYCFFFNVPIAGVFLHFLSRFQFFFFFGKNESLFEIDFSARHVPSYVFNLYAFDCLPVKLL